ncbi:MAG: HD domain-containing protein [Nitrospirae bacterium]|nr:HD domain-containing protein [Nitrospirota bacterium]
MNGRITIEQKAATDSVYEKSLKAIIVYVEGLTQTDILRWFTKHGFNHSLRVLKFANEIIGTWDNQDLNVDECYVLTAACYLHDIGMFTDRYTNKYSGALTNDDYDTIREEHPDITAKILGNEYEITSGNSFRESVN